MKSISGSTWKTESMHERLILKKKQDFNISYLLSKIFLDKKYSDEEIQNSLIVEKDNNITYQNEDFVNAGNIFFECLGFLLQCYDSFRNVTT